MPPLSTSAAAQLPQLLAALAPEAMAPAGDGTRADFVERLSHWLGWTGAIELAAALGPLPAQPGARLAAEPAGALGPALGQALARLQARLQADIAAGPAEPLDGPPDFAPWRRHVLALQQAMQADVDALRGRLRQALLAAAQAPGAAPLARLAAIDAVLQQQLGPQQRSLLALVPLRLQHRYEQLQAAAAAGAPGAAPPAATSSPATAGSALPGEPAWLQAFHTELQALLRAELAQLLLPLRGLLAALPSAAATAARAETA